MGDDVIIKRSLDLIDENGKETLESDGFTELRPEVVKTVISRDTLDVQTEVDVWKACTKWAEAECQRQGKSVSPCMVLASLASKEQKAIAPVAHCPDNVIIFDFQFATLCLKWSFHNRYENNPQKQEVFREDIKSSGNPPPPSLAN